MRKLVILTVACLAVPATALAAGRAPKPPTPTAVPMGTLAVCNVSGARPITTALAFTLSAPASAGGTQSVSVLPGACAPQIFYPVGTAVVVNEIVPPGYAVTSIGITGASTMTTNTPQAGSATIAIGSGQSVLSFTTSAPPVPCKVPAIRGYTLAAARAALLRHGCAAGRVTRAYSSRVRIGRVISQSPGAGAILAHGAPVSATLSRGPR